ncbi:MAG: LysM peptidoglycan-binding domain-containing protein [Clostridia bacterium]|nr:LysM peptidoglycan-binding domain-containing protein [Clostridia bacterium]
MSEATINSQMPKKAVITSVSSDIQLVNEISEEFSLPDYIPEVRRVLHTRASVLPEGKFISDSGTNTSLEFDGTVTYTVIYTDDEGKLRSIPLSSAYEGKTIIPDSVETVFIDTGVDNVNCRVTAPRKLTIKTRLKSRILSFVENEIEEQISPKSTADEMYIQRRTKTLNTVSLKPVSMQNIRMSDKFDIGSKASMTPLMCDAQMIITDCKARSGYIAVRGTVNVRCLCNDGEKEIMLTKSLPVYEDLEAEGSLATDSVRCVGRCVSLSVSNEQSSDTSHLFFDLNCEIEGEFYRNEESPVTEDCYSTKHETETAFKEIDTYSLVLAKNHSFSVNDKFKRKEPEIEEIIDTLCEVLPDKAEIKNGKIALLGKVLAQVIGKTKNGEFLCEEYEIPFRTDMICDGEDIISRINYDATVNDARYENDKFCIMLEIYPSLSVLKKEKTEILDSAILNKDSEYKNDASCVRIFFPKDGDILWEVAKKYHTTERKIVEDNDLSSYSLENVKSIII